MERETPPVPGRLQASSRNLAIREAAALEAKGNAR
jgi:hypothetical protein